MAINIREVLGLAKQDKATMILRRQDKAAELRRAGHNCAQCVLMSISDKVGLDRSTACRLSAGLGMGVAGSGEICGAVTAMAIAEGMCHGTSTEELTRVAKNVRKMMERFKAENNGRICCRDLKDKADVRPCIDLIRQSVGIFLESRYE